MMQTRPQQTFYTPHQALQAAIGHAGSQRVLAEKLGLKQGHISVWLNRDGRVPAERVLAVEAATDRQVSRYALRPDIYGDAPSPGQLFCAAIHTGWQYYQAPIKQLGRAGGVLLIAVLMTLLGNTGWHSLGLVEGKSTAFAQTECASCALEKACFL